MVPSASSTHQSSMEALTIATAALAVAAPTEATDQPAQSPTFLSLPAEIRLLIYEYVDATQRTYQRAKHWQIDKRASVSCSSTGLAAVHQLCRLAHAEALPLIYHNDNTFKVRVAPVDENNTLLPVYSSLTFLRHVRRLQVELHLSMTGRRTSAALEIRRPGEVLSLLRENRVLRTFFFHPVRKNVDGDGFTKFRDTLYELRRRSVREGTEAGKNLRQRELDSLSMLSPISTMCSIRKMEETK
ncbi:uncharacterized protein LTR77_000827 [Saxophila tyrrhenica]|uniref:Uncharacterized protein n=1 Tax=Saxophila tyrrhenica TaxID=1690608 RepID=A0AAV9PTN8_9PEZI|nr:hypothetical protein LTR77_000827 [Saxophila tyrrhenica]